jgi:hypothetical protein
MLNIGFLNESITPEQLNLVDKTLTVIYHQKIAIFPETDPVVNRLVAEYWARIKSQNSTL